MGNRLWVMGKTGFISVSPYYLSPITYYLFHFIANEIYLPFIAGAFSV